MATPSYTADDGLRLMILLGLQLNDRETDMFREEFPRLYGTSNRHDFIGTCWELYSGILPFKAYPTETHDEQVNAILLHLQRDSGFYSRLERKDGLRGMLERGIPMKEIIAGYI